jgi:hypothetical protein
MMPVQYYLTLMDTWTHNPMKPAGAAAARVPINWISVFRIFVSGLYRLAVSCGALWLVWHGASAWVILAALPLLILGPRSR